MTPRIPSDPHQSVLLRVLMDRARGPRPWRSYTTRGPGVLAARGPGRYGDKQPHQGLTRRIHADAKTCPCPYCETYRASLDSGYTAEL